MLQEEEYDSDTSDEDFVPEGIVESEDDAVSDGDDDEGDDAGEGDEETTTKGKKKKKQRRKGKQKQTSNDVKEEESEKEETKEVDKKKEESIWADFLADVEDKPSPPPKPKASSWGALLGNKKSSTSSSTTSTAAKPQPAPKKEEKKETSNKQETVKITQVFEFAGEEVRVEKEVDANSAEAQAAKCSAALASSDSKGTPGKAPPGVGGIKRPGGLSGLVGFLDNKKQKLTTLEKTKLDWNAFKSEEGIDEELEKHKKSKHGYLDKQDFLERADLRQFEIERSMRMSKRSNR